MSDSGTRISNDDTVESVPPGTLLVRGRGRVVFEVIQVERRGAVGWLMGRLRDTRTGSSVGWRYLDRYRRATAAEAAAVQR